MNNAGGQRQHGPSPEKEWYTDRDVLLTPSQDFPDWTKVSVPRTQRSDRLRKRAEMVIPGGCSTESKQPAALFGLENGPAYFRSASGVEIVDVDGCRIVDFAMALGPCVLGYNHPVVVEAVQRALGDGIVSILSSPLEVEVAELIVSLLPGIDQVRFMKSGAEAATAAIRLARAFTGREHVLGCGYFGWHDWSQAGEGVPAATRTLFQEFAFNDVEAFSMRFKSLPGLPAAVIMEPVMHDAPEPEFLETVRTTCARHGVVLIWDEIKTGARLAPGGAQERYGLVPDLTVLGKAIAGGMPLGAVGGKKDIMQTWPKVWISSTFAGESLSLAASLAVLEFIRDNPVCRHIEILGARLLAGFREMCEEYPGCFSCSGIPQMNALALKDGLADRSLMESKFFLELYSLGYLLKRNAYNFVSYSHAEHHIDGCLDACRRAARNIGLVSP